MKRIIVGLILILFDFNLSFTIGRFWMMDILPDFLGYWLVFQSLSGIVVKEEERQRIKQICIGYGSVTFIHFLMNLGGITFSGVSLYLWGVVDLVLFAYLAKNLQKGVEQPSEEQGEVLRRRTNLFIKAVILSIVLGLFPPFHMLGAIFYWITGGMMVVAMNRVWGGLTQ